MKTLRLFISYDLDDLINWTLVEDNEKELSGSSSFEELTQTECDCLEVYLDANCCSIFKTTITGISDKKLTEELVLGLLEDNLVDDIELVIPIIMRIDEEFAYIAVFNREYYNLLVEKIENLNKTINFIQSFVYSTVFNENSWTVYLSDEQNFVRTSKYEYFLLDDKKPIPELLEDMLNGQKPEALYVYPDKNFEKKAFEKKYNIKCNLVTDLPKFGHMVWNFYNRKSSKFKIKFEKPTVSSLQQLFKTFKYFLIFIIIFWFLDASIFVIHNLRLNSQIKAKLKNIVPSKASPFENLSDLIHTANNKLLLLKHQRGIYDQIDAIPLFQNFLQVVSNINPNDITQINYTSGKLEIFLSQRFDTNQFDSYKNIFSTQRIDADIISYKEYSKNNKVDNSSDSGLLTSLPNQAMVSDDTAWVITLKTSLIYSNKKGKN